MHFAALSKQIVAYLLVVWFKIIIYVSYFRKELLLLNEKQMFYTVMYAIFYFFNV